MSNRPERPFTYLGSTTGMCRTCRKLVTARIKEQGGQVYQENLCPTCGPRQALIAESLAWFTRVNDQPVRARPPRLPGHPVKQGCPLDCGPCAFHAGTCHLPVFSITNACDLACPICFTYNRTDARYHMSPAELASLLDKLLARTGPLDLINITGGEPFMHPDLLVLIREAQSRPDIGRVTINSNGIRLAREPELVQKLAEMGVYLILSFDTLDGATAVRIHGRDVVAEKLRALENLQRAGVGTTLLHVQIPGVNDSEFGRILDLALDHPVVRSITVQTMTYTGFGGGCFEPRSQLPLDRSARLIEEATGGRLPARFFRSLPSAHPRCYQIAYAFKRGRQLDDFARIFTDDEFDELMGGGYLLRPSAETQHLFTDALNRLWAEGGNEDLLQGFKQIVKEMYPERGPAPTTAERQRIGENHVLTVYLHAHMDEDTFDVARVATCPDQVPDPEGRLIPACAYNLFYRMKDPRFWVEPAKGGGA